MDQLTELYRNRALDLQKKITFLENQLHEVRTAEEISPFFSTKEFAKQFYTFPMTQATARGVKKAGEAAVKAVTQPGETARSVVGAGKKAVEAGAKAAQHPVQTTANVLTSKPAKFTGVLLGAGVPAYFAGHYARELADPYIEALPIPDSTVPYPGSKESLKSAVDWATMSGTATALGNVLTGAPITAGLGTHIAAGAIGGLAAPSVAYGGYKAGEALGQSDVVQDIVARLSGIGGIEKTKGQSAEEISKEAAKLKERSAKARAEGKPTNTETSWTDYLPDLSSYLPGYVEPKKPEETEKEKEEDDFTQKLTF